jgi:hypothetical protein
MTTHDTSRLSDYLDDDLAPSEREAVRTHLESCPECAAELAALRDLKGRAASLSSEQPVAGDPWPAILARIESRPAGADRGRVLPWRVTLSLPQLAAAAALLLAVGMGGMWMQMRDAGPGASAPPAGATPAGVVPATLADASFDATVADLEAALAAGRERLDPATIAVLEENLAAIDAAIAQAREALAADPANVGLTRHLLRARAMRLGVLRRAVAAAG